MLEISGLKAGYGAVRILNGITMKVPKGKIVALLGGNGTGKSTLLKSLSGLVTNTEGSVLLDGEEVRGMRSDKLVRRGLVQVTQGKEAFPAMTIEENLRIGGFIHTDRRKVKDNLDRVYSYFPDLAKKSRERAATLSGGQLQMLVIGRGLMADPKCLLLDEPSAALAPLAVMDIFRTINRICREGLTVLIVEQNVRMALLLAEYGYVIRDGVIAVEDEAHALINDDRVRNAYLGGTVVGASGQA